MTPVKKGEPHWHAAVAVVLALLLYVTLPSKIVVGPLWLLPVLALTPLVLLLAVSPRRTSDSRWHRMLSIVNIAILGAFNVATVVLFLFVESSTKTHKPHSGEQLLQSALQIWLTNVLVYGLWYWEMDGGGPEARMKESFEVEPQRFDFIFPQWQCDPETRRQLNWRPRFIDYIFLSFTNATAFSPTDTFPFTPLAKGLMMAEALTSLVTIAIVAGRAVNALG